MMMLLVWGGLNALTLFGLMRLFERDRSEIDGFDVAVAAAAPPVINLIIGIIAGIFGLASWMVFAAWILFVPAVMLILWKMAGIPLRRTILYAFALLVISVLLVLAVAMAGPGHIGQPN